jgi:hypothetical protein
MWNARTKEFTTLRKLGPAQLKAMGIAIKAAEALAPTHPHPPPPPQCRDRVFIRSNGAVSVKRFRGLRVRRLGEVP